MQHDDIAGRADLGGAAVIERLHADVGPADGVGVVTMRVEAMPGEPGFEELHAVRERSAAQPVGRRRPARSFKTRPTVAAYRLLDHESAPIRIMTSEQVVGFLLFAVAAAGTPGPSNLLLTETGATVGVVRGLPCLLGVSIGMGVMMFVVAFGLGSLVLANPTVLRLLSWLGALVLLRIAWQIAAARGRAPVGARRPVGFIGAAAFQWINPKSWVACAGATATYFSPAAGGALAQAVVLALLFVAASLPCCSVWLAFGAGTQRMLRGERARRRFHLAMAVLLAGSVLLILH
jgi:threonine/homoserine/homoserine lactone efflux protein